MFVFIHLGILNMRESDPSVELTVMEVLKKFPDISVYIYILYKAETLWVGALGLRRIEHKSRCI